MELEFDLILKHDFIEVGKSFKRPLYRRVMDCMLANEHLNNQEELCSFPRMLWQHCMDQHWRLYYPAAANAEQRSKKT